MLWMLQFWRIPHTPCGCAFRFSAPLWKSEIKNMMIISWRTSGFINHNTLYQIINPSFPCWVQSLANLLLRSFSLQWTEYSNTSIAVVFSTACASLHRFVLVLFIGAQTTSVFISLPTVVKIEIFHLFLKLEGLALLNSHDLFHLLSALVVALPVQVYPPNRVKCDWRSNLLL